ncbi:hypothetical protein N784_12205 [Pontibacillus litoralis JSM 072002]|uniref:Uncharacterized protein n=1 Tax=Pontibacillus litoralis JSM 072002 TaxID=1385512 RepID=A0A0A5FV28_9BACI|nr:hypothetical protein N784_12205 [Pontibacillus litoralis JSM 072002]
MSVTAKRHMKFFKPLIHNFQNVIIVWEQGIHYKKEVSS